MSDSFYRAFEDKYRGSRELIKRRQQSYLSFITPLLALYEHACTIDLGCGRGEWLELLQELGFRSYGVDLDDGMLAACRELGLSAERADAIRTLEMMESESQTIVSGFHIAEHISFSQLQTLVQQALRVLKPAGLLILETPNPENIVVSTSEFYLDPTHRQPIPPKLLSFMTEFYGFCRTKVARLQEPQPLLDGRVVTLQDVLLGVSPDFAVIAQKYARSECLALFDQPFEKEYGISLEALAARHDQQVKEQVAQDTDALSTAKERARQAESDLYRVRDALQAALAKAQESQINELKLYDQLQTALGEAQRAETQAVQSHAALEVAEGRARAAAADALQLAKEREAATDALQLAEDQVREAETRAMQVQARLEARQAQLEVLEDSARRAAVATLDLSREYERALSIVTALRASGSWQITRPLRMIGYLARGHAGLALMEIGIHRRHVERLAAIFRRSPRSEVVEPRVSSAKIVAPDESLREVIVQDVATDLDHFPPLARRIYTYLKSVSALPRSEGVSEGKTPARTFSTFDYYLRRGLQREPSDARPRLAFVSPVPPEPTGIAEYSRQLLKELSKYYRIEVIISQDVVADDLVASEFSIRHPQWLKENVTQFDRVLYHFGNSPFHKHMISLIEEIPGTVVLHDFFLGHLLAFLEQNAIEPYCWTRALYGSHGYSVVKERYDVRDLDSVIMKYPANLGIIQSAEGLIVHSEHARNLADKWYGHNFAENWKVIPLLREPAASWDRDKVRADLDLDKEAFVVCSFGLLSPLKFSHRILEAWLHSRLARDAHCVLIFVGESPSGEYDARLRATIATSTLDEQVYITGWVDPETYQKYLVAADLAVQLRSFSRGETSAAVLDCMSYGLPTIVNAHGSAAELSSDSVWMLPDDFNDTQLIEAMEVLWLESNSRHALGQHAAQTIVTTNAPKACAAYYAEAIEEFHARAAASYQTIIKMLDNGDAQATTDAQCRITALQVTRALSSKRPQKLLLLDVTATFLADLRTGIERVARALLVAILQAPPAGYRVEPVYLSDGGGHWHYRYARRYTLELLGCTPYGLVDEIVLPQSGDCLVGLDLASRRVVSADRAGLFDELRDAGVKIFFMVYDLLPVQMPEVFPPGADISHERWLNVVSRFDGAICGSKTVADELALWVEHNGHRRRKSPLAIRWSHYGSDLRNSAPTLGIPSDATQRLQRLGKRPSFLMTGTIEPRKGHAQVIEAFTRLWREGHDINLVIVGNEGWRGLPEAMRRTIPTIVRTIRSHDEFDKRLFWLEGISDEYLDKVYALSTCMIAASLGEGFGLPLIEAARHRLPIIARDIPVFREVALEYAQYFSGNDPKDIANAVVTWLQAFECGTQPNSDDMPWLTWEQSAERLLKIVVNDDAV
jgi:glycosyltransferase involved in cell wall biosynthesis/SAM-dependent methyltransferase